MNPIDEILPEEVKRRLDSGEKLCIVDVREDEEVAQGMIPGAIHIPLGELPFKYETIDKNQEVILVCRSGNRSGKATEYLKLLGFSQPKNMIGGMLAWDQLTE